MDYIKKTICLEGVRTRTQGIMPYYEFGVAYSQHSGSSCYTQDELELTEASGHNGNWGQFVANPCFLAKNGKTYEGMLSKYYSLLNSVRNGIKLRKVQTKEGETVFVEGLDKLVYSGNCFEAVDEPNTLYAYAAYNALDFNSVGGVYFHEGDEYVKSEFLVLIPDYDEFLNTASYFDGISDYPRPEGYTIGEDRDPHTKWARYCRVIDVYIGKINVPSRIYNKHLKVPKEMSCADVEDYIDWLVNYRSVSADCCNERLWEDMGGNDMLKFLSVSARTKCDEYHGLISGLTYSVPYVEMPVLLTQNFTDVGVLTNIDGVPYVEDLPGPSSSENDDTRPHGELHLSVEGSGFTNPDEIKEFVISGRCLTIDQINMQQERETRPTTEEFEADPEAYTDESGFTTYPIEVESLLETLRSPKKYTDDEDNVLPGLFKYFQQEAGADSTGKMFRCIKQSDESFYRLVVVSAETTVVISGVQHRKCTVNYDYLQVSMTKDELRAEVEARQDPNDNYEDHFYTYKPLPTEKRTFTDTDPDYETQISDYISELSGKIETDYFLRNPISVAAPEWRMETEDVPNSVSHFKNGDGLSSDVLWYPESELHSTEGKFYRTITTCSAGIEIAKTEEIESGHDNAFMDHYYFKVKYDNSSGSPMDVPYETGNTTNVHYDRKTDRYRGDILVSATTVDGPSGVTYFEAVYVIGGYLSYDSGAGAYDYVGSGDIYYEKHVLDPGHVDFVSLDGVGNVPVWSEYIDFEADAKEFYSTRYNLYRTGNTANIIEFTSGEFWNDEYSYDAYLTKEEYLTNFSLPPKTDVNVTIDRGGVSAFEKHYKLAECNTMQDLVNYGNNFFNL